MKIIKSDDFSRAFEKLPQNVKRLFFIQETRFLINPGDPRLHIKKVRGLPLALSFRITRHYRTLFYFQDQITAVFFDIDHRKDVYRNM
ncbi:MAG: hypothetical protein Q7S12_00420 [bacterium]|nr:hypothetical protein [bacterium]